jgi:hypothetical protein
VINPAREAARAKLLAAGKLVVDLGIPPGSQPLPDEKLKRLAQLLSGSRSVDDLIDTDRGRIEYPIRRHQCHCPPLCRRGRFRMGAKLGSTSRRQCLGNFGVNKVEMFSLLVRKQREGLLSANDIAQIQTTFLIHVEKEYLAIPFSRPVLAQARQLLVNYPLRTLDAIQLACAQDAVSTLNEPMTFISGDTNLLAAAAASEGFAADNPNLHP